MQGNKGTAKKWKNKVSGDCLYLQIYQYTITDSDASVSALFGDIRLVSVKL